MMLRGEAPAAWAGFVWRHERVCRGHETEMLKAQPELLQRGQGMALMAHEIASILVDAPKTYDKMQQMQRKSDVRPRQNTSF